MAAQPGTLPPASHHCAGRAAALPGSPRAPVPPGSRSTGAPGAGRGCGPFPAGLPRVFLRDAGAMVAAGRRLRCSPGHGRGGFSPVWGAGVVRLGPGSDSKFMSLGSFLPVENVSQSPGYGVSYKHLRAAPLRAGGPPAPHPGLARRLVPAPGGHGTTEGEPRGAQPGVPGTAPLARGTLGGGGGSGAERPGPGQYRRRVL